MRKIITVVLSAVLVLGAFGAPAAEAGKKKKKTREVQGTYAAPATIVGSCTQTDGIGCMTIPNGAKETYVSAKVTDATGQPVLITIQADLDGDMRSETLYGTFCGETDEPIKVDGGVQLIFWVSPATKTADRVTGGCIPGQGTEGTLDVTFSNLP
ncbi:MAG: hypothetical protein KY391_01495 [Actinobacteria bacterium]|nr:hypothetical protein [Actinomycetota bacterium]